jgi:acyl carrier protein
MDEIAALSTDPLAQDEISSGPVRFPTKCSASNRVKDLIAQTCEVDRASISDAGHLLAYGLDSVRAIDLLVSLEESFHVTIPEREAVRLKTVRDVIRCVEEKTSAR